MPTSSTKAPRLSILIPSFAGGGAEKNMLHLSNEFLNYGLEIDLVVMCAEGPYRNNVPSEVRLIDLKARRMVTCLPKLAAYLNRERPDVMLAGGKAANLFALISRFMISGPTRIVVRQNNVLPPVVRNIKNWRDMLMRIFIRLSYPRADAIVAISKGVAEELMKIVSLPVYEIKIVYNPVITKNIFSMANEPLEHPWFTSDSPPVILGVGRLVAQKDFPTLLRAFAILREKQAARLIILGEGWDRAVLERLIKDLGLETEVSLPGFVDNPYKYMKRANIFVLSSQREGFGNVLVESMAFGTRVVSTDCHAGPREILEDGKWGALIPVGNPESLAKGILDTLHKNIDGDALKQRALEFSVPIIAKQYLKVLFSNRPCSEL